MRRMGNVYQAGGARSRHRHPDQPIVPERFPVSCDTTLVDRRAAPEMARRHIIAVIGAGNADQALQNIAHEVGERLAQANCIVVTGGLGGVMEAASRGARAAGGLVVGIVPGPAGEDANDAVDVAIATGMGDARNAIIANTAHGFVAVGGAWGTLSEIAFARKRGKPVAAVAGFGSEVGVVACESAEEAVEWVLGRV